MEKSPLLAMLLRLVFSFLSTCRLRLETSHVRSRWVMCEMSPLRFAPVDIRETNLRYLDYASLRFVEVEGSNMSTLRLIKSIYSIEL